MRVLTTLLAMLLALSCHAQFLVAPLEQPNLDAQRSGRVEALLRLPDGRFMLGGRFSRLGTLSSNGTARLLSDGSIDPSFSAPDVANARDFVLDSLGRLYVLSAERLVRLQSTGALDSGFPVITPTPAGSLRALEIDGDQLFVSGSFTSLAGVARNRLAKVLLSGVVDSAWAPEPNGVVLSLRAPGNGFVYVGGTFSQLGGAARIGLARVATTGAGTADAWNPLLSSGASVRAMDADASALYFGGDFFTVNGSTRTRLAKVNLQTGVLDPTFSANLNNAPDLLAQIAGSIYLGRDSFSFSVSSSAGNLSGARMARLAASSGAVDVVFNPYADTQPGETASVLAVVPSDASGRLVVGGDFASLSASNVRLGLAALNADGSVDALSSLPEASAPASWFKLEPDSDGAAFALSNARRINGSARRDLVRIQNNGAVTAGFRPPNAPIRAFAVHAGQAVYIADDLASQIRKIDRLTGDPIAGFTPISYSNVVGNMQIAGAHLYIYGSFTLNGITPSLGGYARISLATGLVDTSYRPVPSNGASIAQTYFDASNNALFLVGDFTSVNTVARPGIAKLDGNTLAVDSTWNPSFVGGNPFSAALDGQGGLYVTGNFSSVNGTSCRAPAKLLVSGTGSLDASFSCARAAGFTSALALNSEALYAGSSSQLVRFALNQGGVPDPNWSAAVSFPDSLAADAARVFVLGNFSSVSGVARSGLAALPAVERPFANGFE